MHPVICGSWVFFDILTVGQRENGRTRAEAIDEEEKRGRSDGYYAASEYMALRRCDGVVS